MAEISLQDYYEQVEDMIDQGRYAQAVAHGKHILETYPKCVAGYRLLGRAMLEARRDDDALDMFLRVLSADPEDMLSWVALSEIYDRRDELDVRLHGPADICALAGAGHERTARHRCDRRADPDLRRQRWFLAGDA